MTHGQLLQLLKLASGEDVSASAARACASESLPAASIDLPAADSVDRALLKQDGKPACTMRVLLLTDEPMQAAGLSVVLAPHGIRLSTCGLRDWTAAFQSQRPDVVLVNLVPDFPFRRIAGFRRKFPSSRIVLWSRSVSHDVAVPAIEAGVAGVVGKTQDSEILLHCLRKVADGELWYDKDVATKFLALRGFPLTDRESELLTLVSSGMGNGTIAARLGISESTVRAYVFRLMEKVGARNRIELVLYGLGRPDVSGSHGSETSGRIDKNG